MWSLTDRFTSTRPTRWLFCAQVVDGREDFRPAADSWVKRALALDDPVVGDAFVPAALTRRCGLSPLAIASS